MSVKNAIKMFRYETGLTQVELSKALHINFATVNRWENKDIRPSQSISLSIFELAKEKNVSQNCLDALNLALFSSRYGTKQQREEENKKIEDIKLKYKYLLTSEQLKMTLDNIDLGVTCQRIYHNDLFQNEIVYCNKHFTKMSGYTLSELKENNKKKYCFAILSEFKDLIINNLKRLLNEEIGITDFDFVVKCKNKFDEIHWIEIKVISYKTYSYGKEIFVSYNDVSNLMIAKQEYEKEILYREISMGGFYACFHCDLMDNKILRVSNGSNSNFEKLKDLSVDELFFEITKSYALDEDIEKIRERFKRTSLIKNYISNNIPNSFKTYSSVDNRWLRFDYYIIKNPFNNHYEALIYAIDIQKYAISSKIADIVSKYFFDYIACINVNNNNVEIFHTANINYPLNKKVNYDDLFREKLKEYSIVENIDLEIEKFKLTNIVNLLNQNSFFSEKITLKKNNKLITRKIFYTYMDDTHTNILIAQGEIENLENIMRKMVSNFSKI